MPAISRIQTGSVSLAVGTTSGTATPSTFVVDDSLLLFTVSISDRSYADRVEFGRVRGVVTNTTTLTFARGVAAVCAIEIRWTLIEFASGALAHPIRRGTSSITADPTDLTISTVNDTSSAVILSYLIGNSFGTSYPTAYLTSSTNLRIDLDAAPASGDCQIAYQVVSFKPADAVSYTGANAFVANDTSDVVTITSVDLTKALVYGSFIVSSPATVPRSMIRMRLTGATSLTLDRTDAGGGSTPTARWHVLEMKDASKVEAWSTTLQAANTSPTTQPSWGTAMTNGAIWEQGTWPNARNTDYRALQNDIATRITLDSPQDSITITRGYGSASYDVELAGHVIEFAGSAGGAVLAGDASATATATGALTTAIPLAGDASAVATATGALTTSITLLSDAAAVATATGALTTSINLAGDAFAVATATGDLGGGAAALAGDAIAQATATGDLTTAIVLEGSAVAQATATGDLGGGAASLAGDAVSQATATGDLTTSINLAGDAFAVATATGDLTVPSSGLSGDAVVQATATGSLTTAIPLAGSALAVATATGDLLVGALVAAASRRAVSRGRATTLSR